MTNGLTLWFTGLPGSGKITLLNNTKLKLEEMGVKDIIVLDFRKEWGTIKGNRDVSDLSTNTANAGYFCRASNDLGKTVLVASPIHKRKLRDGQKDERKNFLIIHCQASFLHLLSRDTDGLYKKALQGEILGFSGIDLNFEEPISPDISLNTVKLTPEQCVSSIIDKVNKINKINPEN